MKAAEALRVLAESYAKGSTDIISSCEACPYSYPQWVSGRIVCSHDGVAGTLVLTTTHNLLKLPERPPPECPLRGRPTLVALVEGEHADA